MTLPPSQPARRRPSRDAWHLALAGAAAAMLAACATPGPDRIPGPPRDAAALALPAASTPALPASWWTGFGDPALDDLVARALREHPSLAVARSRVDRAVALAAGVQAGSGPQAGLSANVTTQRYTEHGLIPPPIAGHTRTSATVQAAASWSPDLFGQHAAEVTATIDQARAAQADAALTAQGLASQVTRGYVGVARLIAQRGVAERTLAQRTEMLALIRQRVGAGLDTRLELAQGEAALPDVRAQIEALDEQLMLARRQLAVLTGQPPEALSALTPRLDALRAPDLPGTLGADLLGRRPDLVAARWRVEAAAADTAAARVQFYPNVNLVAFVGLNALGLNHVLDLGSRQLGVSPALRLPLFDGGRLRAQQSARQADWAAAVAQYDVVLLDAVREAGDAIGSAASVERQQREQSQALAGAEAAHDIARQRFGAGLGNYLVVLNAETQALAQRRAAIDLRARRLDTRAVLARALGGGWTDDTAALAAAR